jgi:TFIIF-interacting CTD phosphatase-like protein
MEQKLRDLETLDPAPQISKKMIFENHLHGIQRLLETEVEDNMSFIQLKASIETMWNQFFTSDHQFSPKESGRPKMECSFVINGERIQKDCSEIINGNRDSIGSRDSQKDNNIHESVTATEGSNSVVSADTQKDQQYESADWNDGNDNGQVTSPYVVPNHPNFTPATNTRAGWSFQNCYELISTVSTTTRCCFFSILRMIGLTKFFWYFFGHE